MENAVKSVRWKAVIFGTLLCITFIALVYAFVQKAEAKRQAVLATECARQSVEMRQQLEASNRNAQKEVDRAQAALLLAEEMKVRAESESKRK